MKASEITYYDFLQLPEQQRAELEEVYICAKDTFTNVDVMQWSWSNVKSTQELLRGDVTYLDILKTVQIEAKKLTLYSPAATIIKLFRAIQKQINQTVENESTALKSEIDPKARLAMDAVGGFESFGYYPQTFELCRHLNMSYSQVEQMPYSTCFVALAYFDRLDKYLKKYNETPQTT